MPLGPVSALLEQQLLREVNAHGLVVWLDAEGAFTAYVDALAPRVNVAAFRGSFLALMLDLRQHASTLDKPPLVVHLPGFNHESVLKTPALEVYRAGLRFERNLVTVVREAANGRKPLDEIEAFLAKPGLTLDRADAWLQGSTDSSPDVYSAWLEKLDAPSFLRHLPDAPKEPASIVAALRRHANVLFGVTADWLEEKQWSGNINEAVHAWLLCVEYVHDLKAAPQQPSLVPLKKLPDATVKRCRAETVRMRRESPDAYRARADGVELWLQRAERERDPRDLGRIDTFRFESHRIYVGAVRALRDGDYAQAREWADAHENDNGAFWVQQEPARKIAWQLLSSAARLGLAVANAGRPLDGAQSHEEALARYVSSGAAIDALQRDFEQRFKALYGPSLPELAVLDAGIERLRGEYLQWANQLAKDFAALCRQTGPLPPDEFRQRNLFNEAVVPLLTQGRTALFVVDAFRYEMAVELERMLRDAGVRSELKARLAELPTLTSVGMNALAPVTRDGRLVPVVKDGELKGFRSGESQVLKPADRLKAMEARTGAKAADFKLEDLREPDADKLKRQIAQAQLIVVHSQEIDTAGENGLGPWNFENVLRDLIQARARLEAAGVTQFVFTADHGFLLGRRRRRDRFGARGQTNRRHAFSATQRNDADYLTVSFAQLGYEGEGYIVLREDVDEFDVSEPFSDFSHGGNSLQERVIPVLEVSRSRGRPQTLRCVLDVKPASGALGAHRFYIRASPRRETGQAPLAFASSALVDVRLYVPGRDDIRVVLKGVDGGGGSQWADGLRLDAATQEWTEVFFELWGNSQDRVSIEAAVVADAETAIRPADLYAVTLRSGGRRPPPEAAPTAAPAAGWGERLSDPDAGRVFDFLEQHGAVTEAQMVQLLGGNPRKARAFAARFDEHRKRLTFDVEVSATADGKLYTKVRSESGAD